MDKNNTINSSNSFEDSLNFNQTSFSNMSNGYVNYKMVSDFSYTPRQGWQCPICGRIYSPDTIMCPYCGNYDIKTTTTIPIEDIFDNKITTIKAETDEFHFPDVRYDTNNVRSTETKTIHDVARLFVHTRTPKTIMQKMDYVYDETQTLETNIRFFLKDMEERNRLEELYVLLTDAQKH